jgi:hypothetical protein
MSLTHCINKRFDKKFKAEWTPKIWRTWWPNDMYELFVSNGEGMYVSILESTDNDFVSKMISLITGKFSHCFHMYYSEDLRSKILDEEYNRIITNWQVYYGFSKQEAETKFLETKVLILASADKIGMDYLDFRAYADRKQSIRKLYTTDVQDIQMLKWYLSADTMNSIYDYVGLAFFRIIQDPLAFYCSEIVYDSADKFGYKMAKSKRPSPTDIYNYKQNGKIIFENI